MVAGCCACAPCAALWPPGPPDCDADSVASAATMARSVVASCTALAFFSGTTQMLPGRVPGTSSLASSCLACAMRAALEARTSTLFERGSATTEVRRLGSASAAPAPPPAPPAVPLGSSSFCSVAAASMATAFFSGISSVSPAAGLSIEAMMRAMRRRLSA